MGEQALSTYSYEAYLALEAESEVKHEYHDGFIVAMACAKPLHVKLCTQAARAIGNEIDKAEKPCDTFVADLRIRIESVNRAYYPDITVTCDSHISSPKDKHALINPILIVEVLSDSTESFDRGTKFHHYRHLPSFQEYVLISQQEYEVTTHFRQGEDLW